MLEQENGAELLGRLRSRNLKLNELRVPWSSTPLVCGQVVEISGPENCGKTQALLSACVQCILPKQFNGLESGAVYFDAEHKMSEYRLISMLECRINQYLRSSTSDSEEQTDSKVEETIQQCMTRFHLLRVYSTDDFLHAFDHLDQLFAKTSVFLLCIDSVSAFYWMQRTQAEYDSDVVSGRFAQLKWSNRFSLFMREHFVLVLAARFAVLWRNKFSDCETEGGSGGGETWHNVMDKTWKAKVTRAVRFSRNNNNKVIAKCIIPDERQEIVLAICDAGVIFAGD